MLSLMGIVAYGFTAVFTFFAFGRLKQQERDLMELKAVTTKTLSLTAAEHLRASFEAINDMKDMLRELIDADRFEEAEHVKAAIATAEASALRELDSFKEAFGDAGVDVKVMKYGKV